MLEEQDAKVTEREEMKAKEKRRNEMMLGHEETVEQISGLHAGSHYSQEMTTPVGPDITDGPSDSYSIETPNSSHSTSTTRLSSLSSTTGSAQLPTTAASVTVPVPRSTSTFQQEYFRRMDDEALNLKAKTDMDIEERRVRLQLEVKEREARMAIEAQRIEIERKNADMMAAFMAYLNKNQNNNQNISHSY